MSSNEDFSVRIEGLSKRYLLPHQNESMGRFGKMSAHMREFFPFMGREERDYFWAIKDITFDVRPGEILGILGRNGSGKSTLLKILSGVSEPSSGRALLRGRVGSLLEVGTGFHPDLTGRENVFMSGVLLGLSRKEIASKFDSIVDFSGIEKFIDMPVKRYSSGMYVRLAYAVASLLRTDILILDEVMAVGDAAFLEKSQKNIENIANDGRTILFVSHNLQALRSLCHTGVLLEQGKLVTSGDVDDVVAHYMRGIHGLEEGLKDDFCDLDPFVNLEHCNGWEGDRPLNAIKSVETFDGDGVATRKFHTGDTIILRISYEVAVEYEQVYFSVLFINEFGDRAQVAYSLHDNLDIDAGIGGIIECRIEDLRLISGDYSIVLDFGEVVDGRLVSLDCVPDATRVRVNLGDYLGPLGLLPNQGTFAHRSRWGLLDRNG